MRRTASEKMEIIRLVEETLAELDLPGVQLDAGNALFHVSCRPC